MHIKIAGLIFTLKRKLGQALRKLSGIGSTGNSTRPLGLKRNWRVGSLLIFYFSNTLFDLNDHKRDIVFGLPFFSKTT